MEAIFTIKHAIFKDTKGGTKFSISGNGQDWYSVFKNRCDDETWEFFKSLKEGMKVKVFYETSPSKSGTIFSNIVPPGVEILEMESETPAAKKENGHREKSIVSQAILKAAAPVVAALLQHSPNAGRWEGVVDDVVDYFWKKYEEKAK